MAVFEVSSRNVGMGALPQKKRRLVRREWSTILRFILTMNGAGGLFALLTLFKGSSNTVFILLPVFLALALGQAQGYNLNMLLSGAPIYLLLTGGLTLIYYSILTAIVLLIHQDPNVSHIILITTTLAWVVIVEPVRVFVQRLIEQRFNLRNREAARALEAFTTTLREEIDLDQLRERFLTVIQQTMQPYSITVWIRTITEEQENVSSADKIMLMENDPLMAHLLSHPSVREVDRLQLVSPILQDLKLQKAEILLPLASQGVLLGLLILGPHLNGEAYTREERSMLGSLAPQVAPALRVAQMVQEQQGQIRERERIEQELRTARFIQHSLLPKDIPQMPGWQIAPYYQPAREVGGDFYDFLPFADGRLGLIIGDVTDKGVPAALVMATTHTMLRAIAQEQVSPGEALARVNSLLYAETPERMFVTCFYAILNPQSGQMRYANAGHELPYRRQHGSVTELRATGMPLGMMPGTTYEEQEVILAPGENVLFYSDGLVEAHNLKRAMFDYPRITALVEAHPGGSELIATLLKALASFTGNGWEQEDDVTMVTLCRSIG